MFLWLSFVNSWDVIDRKTQIINPGTLMIIETKHDSLVHLFVIHTYPSIHHTDFWCVIKFVSWTRKFPWKKRWFPLAHSTSSTIVNKHWKIQEHDSSWNHQASSKPCFCLKRGGSVTEFVVSFMFWHHTPSNRLLQQARGHCECGSSPKKKKKRFLSAATHHVTTRLLTPLRTLFLFFVLPPDKCHDTSDFVWYIKVMFLIHCVAY